MEPLTYIPLSSIRLQLMELFRSIMQELHHYLWEVQVPQHHLPFKAYLNVLAKFILSVLEIP